MRLAELVGTLSIAADASAGMPDSHALRGATVAARFAELLGVDDETVHDAYYLPLLAMAGCSAEAHTAASVVTDEVAFGEEIYGLDVGRASDVLPVLLRMARRGRGPLAGLVASARALGLVRLMKEVSRAHCEVAVHLAERFGFDESFRVALLQVFERWDGTGVPERTKGEELPLSLRIAQVAVDANVGHRLGGIEGAVVLTRERAGRGLDPSLVERFGTVAAEACAGLESSSPWTAALDAEPAPHRIVLETAVEEAIACMAHFADMKSRFTRAHSTGVAALASAAARRVGVSEEQRQLVHRAGLLHDIGRVAISATIWDKVEPLSDVEKERIRLHSYVGERVLMRCPSLAGVAAIATLAHERFDESGYHRRLPASALAPVARILAAADVYHALVETRPHRAAFSADRAAHELTQMAGRGSLCPEAVRAVLGAENPTARLPLRPSGLTDRELEVLRLIARGLTNKEIASALDISVKTAGHHVQHVLEKLGVRTRAAATMLAMQQGLVTPGA